jgi:ribosomal protein S12 methylthiotransferase
VTLRTTFIVGFPGETEADFGELCSFVRDTEFDHVGVFTYSHEEGTRAWEFADDVPARTKKARRSELMRLQKQIVGRRHRSRIGETVRVMVDGSSPESPLVLQGRLQGQAPEIDPIVYLDRADSQTTASGDIVAARITGSRDYDLVAAVLQPESAGVTADLADSGRKDL